MDFETIVKISEQKGLGRSETSKKLKQRHLEALKLNWPIQKSEAYLFTGLKSFFEEFDIQSNQKTNSNIDTYRDDSSITITCSSEDIQIPQNLPQGLQIVLTTNEADQSIETDSIGNLHQSINTNQLKILVEKNAVIETPIRIIHLISKSGLEAPSTKIHIMPFGQASVMEEVINPENSCALIQNTLINVEENGKLEHIQYSKQGPHSLLISQTNANVAKNASYTNFLLNFSGRLNRRNLNIKLLESGAHGETYNLYLTSSNEHSDINTVIHHLAPDTTSNQLAKGILDGDSKGIFTGKIFIHPKAQRVSSSQTNKNLLLSKKAQAHSQPQLEIFADDVKCSHGSTTGQLSDEEIFYFESRGIPVKKAKTLLAFGFALEIVSKVFNKNIRNKIETLVMQGLKDKFHIGEA